MRALAQFARPKQQHLWQLGRQRFAALTLPRALSLAGGHKYLKLVCMTRVTHSVSLNELLAPAEADEGESQGQGRGQKLFVKLLWLIPGLATASVLNNIAVCEAEKVLTVVSSLPSQ